VGKKKERRTGLMEMSKTQKAAFPTFPQALLATKKTDQEPGPKTQNEVPTKGGDFYVIGGGKIT
jgi:hypothetical protein